MRWMALALVASGCASRVQQVPPFRPDWEPAGWEVVGRTNHEECGLYVLFIDWIHLFSNRRARVTGAFGIPVLAPQFGPEESRALYEALAKMPEATHLLAHRTHVQTQGVVLFGRPMFGERCAAVDARAVRMADRSRSAAPP